MEVGKLAEGLWRWTVPHPEWTPTADWAEAVGCVYYEPRDGGVVLIDPLLPPPGSDDETRFHAALDRDVRRTGGPVAILISNRFHGRNAAAIRERYVSDVGAGIRIPEETGDTLKLAPARTFGPADVLPGEITPHFIEALDGPEVAFFIAPHRALVVADALLGIGEGGLRLVPESWAAPGEDSARRYRESFRGSVRRLLELAPEMVLTSHGEPIVSEGTRALAEALDAPAWGE